MPRGEHTPACSGEEDALVSKSKSGFQGGPVARRAAPRSRRRTRAFPRSTQGGAADVHALCRTTPELYVVLTPDLTIVDASDAYRRATLVWGRSNHRLRNVRRVPGQPIRPHGRRRVASPRLVPAGVTARAAASHGAPAL